MIQPGLFTVSLLGHVAVLGAKVAFHDGFTMCISRYVLNSSTAAVMVTQSTVGEGFASGFDRNCQLRW